MSEVNTSARGSLRFITCGSVDDGKSTLLGRLLYDAGVLPDDQLEMLNKESRRQHPDSDVLDFSLLTDGLDAERQQGITIDVAYRYFHSARRNFVVADCPGHEQYTRNMATGASHADLAVVLVDARKGLLTQTRRHTYICALLGIRKVILAVNKMDLVDYRQDVYESIEVAYRDLADQLGIRSVHALPVAALTGENVGGRTGHMPWYQGPSLLELLESIDVEPVQSTDFRMPVQWVNRPNQDFRGYAGTICSGIVKTGDEVMIQPGVHKARVARIVTADGDLTQAHRGHAVTLTLDREVDVSRGDVITDAARPAPEADQFAAHLLWMGDEALLPNRGYWLKVGARTVNARVTQIKHKVDVNTQAKLAAHRLALNEVGYCNLDLDHPIAFEPYAANHELGGFILIDRQTHATVACGMLDFALHRASNVHWQHLDVDKQLRARSKGQMPRCLWFTGLSGAGKSTIANLLERRLCTLGYHTYLLDGDNLRHGLNRDLGFTPEARVENVRRVAEVASLMVDAGLIVLVCVISPFRSEREFARNLFGEDEFLEVFVDTSLEECERRDPKGLYRRARAGELSNFTGIDSPYEVPLQPQIHLRTGDMQLDAIVDTLLTRLLPSENE
ncbi:sulfate adenylyltransferase subunit CysN [Dyella caseinilytica]|uniref:Multifunctional fusion protein n=1 Tax=Dyella caseinilytica TaxID=1849581 RepID=A0ABX7GTH7_9GAMM|nr:sulfate adenylyltransferase subunit CysN [Dyella caseinilytica]QRN53067.1 sulfate adenylyltransferase subunit CysN [Dyella caseinilytica]GGA11182.1 adenylyl-sulfate kinase [Dyella caseinilytica]